MRGQGKDNKEEVQPRGITVHAVGSGICDDQAWEMAEVKCCASDNNVGLANYNIKLI